MSDATITSGVRPPSDLAAGVTGSVPSRVAPATLTHADPSPAASACTAPTGIRAVTALVAGSIRATVPSFQLATHTAPSPNATYWTPAPTSIGRAAAAAGLDPPQLALLRGGPHRAAADRDARQEVAAELDRGSARFVRGSILVIEFSRPRPHARVAGRQRAGADLQRDLRHQPPRRGIDARDRLVRIDGPDRPVADRDRGIPVAGPRAPPSDVSAGGRSA